MSAEIGTPLHELFGGNDIVMASTGASIAGKVLEASGFNVSQEAGFAKPAAPGSDIGSLALTNNSAAPRGPNQG